MRRSGAPPECSRLPECTIHEYASMPRFNSFRHQSYPTEPLHTPTRHILKVDPGAVDFGRLHTQLGVRQVVLVPGTFAGDDPFAIGQILRTLGDSLPHSSVWANELADKLAAQTTRVIDSVAHDVGAWSDSYCDRFTELINGTVDVLRMAPPWSGQNHHFARADLAVRLLGHLDQMDLFHGEQVMFWGHSHAGNGFAILSNLLANSERSVNAFFEACEPLDDVHWQKARDILAAGATPHRLAGHVSFVTFGTPVRYGWDTDGFRQLVHVLFDRGTPGDAFTTHPLFPPHSIRDTIDASWGDWVQAFGIAGTDVVPPTPLTMQRDQQLKDMLEAGLEGPHHSMAMTLVPSQRLKDLCSRWKTGTRCHADGLNLLVDYQPSGRTVANGTVESSLFGHGVATTVDWLPAHLALVLQRLSA